MEPVESKTVFLRTETQTAVQRKSTGFMKLCFFPFFFSKIPLLLRFVFCSKRNSGNRPRQTHAVGGSHGHEFALQGLQILCSTTQLFARLPQCRRGLPGQDRPGRQPYVMLWRLHGAQVSPVIISKLPLRPTGPDRSTRAGGRLDARWRQAGGRRFASRCPPRSPNLYCTRTDPH